MRFALQGLTELQPVAGNGRVHPSRNLTDSRQQDELPQQPGSGKQPGQLTDCVGTREYGTLAGNQVYFVGQQFRRRQRLSAGHRGAGQRYQFNNAQRVQLADPARRPSADGTMIIEYEEITYHNVTRVACFIV